MSSRVGRIGWVMFGVLVGLPVARGYAQGPAAPAPAPAPEPAAAAPAPEPAALALEQAVERAEPFVIISVDPPAAAPAPARVPEVPELPPPARDHRARERPAREPAREWYGWQTLSVDAASLFVMTAGTAAAESAGPALVGLVGYLAGAPIVHGVHRNDWALPSFFLRAGSVALLGGGTYVALNGCYGLGDDDTPRGASSCDQRRTVGSVLVILGLATVVGSITTDALVAHSAPSRPETPTLGLWGNPLAGTAGISVTLVR